MEPNAPIRMSSLCTQSCIQSGQKIPRWEPRTRTEINLGQSSDHAQSVSLVLNVTIGHISSQYYIIYDENFDTIKTDDDPLTNKLWSRIVTTLDDNEDDDIESSPIDFGSPPA